MVGGVVGVYREQLIAKKERMGERMEGEYE
jgi:hypothetical protein